MTSSEKARAFEAVLGAIEELAPRIEVVEPGRCAIATRGPSRYHGGDRALAERVHDCVRAALAEHVGGGRVPCPVGVGIADGPRAAAIAAEESVTRGAGTRRPAAPLVVPVGGTAEFLSLLPVDRLRPGRRGAGPGAAGAEGPDELTEVLRRLGLRTVGRFAALPAPDVLARFGAPGMDLHRLATGNEVEPPAATDPQADLRVSAAVDPPAERVDRAAFVAKALADTLHSELATRGLACTRVLVVAETDAGDRIERLWRHEGALSAAGIAQRIRWQLDGWLSTGRSLGRCTGGVSLIELIPDQVVPDDGVQLGFWAEPARRVNVRCAPWPGSRPWWVPTRCWSRSGGEAEPPVSSTNWCRSTRSTWRRGRSCPTGHRGRDACPTPHPRWCGPRRGPPRCSTCRGDVSR